MTPQVSIIMGSTSDLPIMEKAAARLDALGIPFEMLALSAHRTPKEVEEFATSAKERGIKVIIGAAGMAAHLCGVIASMTSIPVIGVPIKASLEDAYLELTGGNTEYNHLTPGARIIILKEGRRAFDTYIRQIDGIVVNRSSYPASYVQDDWRKR